MRGLGRLIVLPWLLVALALQGLAPAQAQAMPRDAFGSPICSTHDASGAGRRHDPSRNQAHDCCAAACALAALGGTPPLEVEVAARRFAVPLAPRPARQSSRWAARALWRPTARGPPGSILAV